MASLEYYLNTERYQERVEEALIELHYERGRGKSFTIDEIAEKARIDKRIVMIILEDLRRKGIVGRRGGRKTKYYVRMYSRTPYIKL